MEFAELVDRAVSLLFPQRCLRCDALVEYDDFLCEKCPTQRVGRVVLPFESDISGVLALTTYNAHTRGMVLKLKEGTHPRVYAFFAGEMRRMLARHWADVRFGAVVPVPATGAVVQARGYNHAQRLAQPLGALIKVPLLPGALCRSDGSKPQHALHSREEREANAWASYEISQPEGLRGKTVLLVDDIVTTGLTAHVCASRLLGAGAEKVYVLVAAATPLHEGDEGAGG